MTDQNTAAGEAMGGVTLRPCPLCGTHNPEMERGFTGMIDVQCMEASCGMMVQSSNQYAAADKWNRRPNPPPPVKSGAGSAGEVREKALREALTTIATMRIEHDMCRDAQMQDIAKDALLATPAEGQGNG